MLKLASGMSRLGTETAFEVLARAKALEAKGKHIINLGIGQPDFQTPDHIVEAAAARRCATAITAIPRPTASRQLREAVAADLHKRHGVECRPGPCPGRARRQGHDVLRHPDVRRARGGDHLSQPRLSDLRERHQLLRRHAGADAACARRTASPSPPTRCCRRSRRAPGSSSSTARPIRPAASCREAEVDKLVAGPRPHPAGRDPERRDLRRDAL